jgi:membrane fusion protein (multidrug efflux system)
MSFVKQVVLLAGLALIAVVGYWGWHHLDPVNAAENARKSSQKRSPPTVEIATAARREMVTAIDAVGTTRALRAIEITPMVTGRVLEIGITPGASVKNGDVLLRLDNEMQHADLTESIARLTEAQKNLARARSLRNRRVISSSSVESLVAALAAAKADNERALERLKDRTILAPFDGVTGLTQISLGARVTEGDKITTLDDLSDVEIEFSLPEAVFGLVKPGQSVDARAAAFPNRMFTGTINSLDSRIDPTSRAFKVRALVANTDHALPAGMFMHLTLVLQTRQAITVPEEAIVADGRRAFLLAIIDKGGKLIAEQRIVEVGQREFGFVEILSGVVEGEAVVVRGLQRAKAGNPVRLAKGTTLAGGATRTEEKAKQ